MPGVYFQDVQVQPVLSEHYAAAEIQIDAGFRETGGQIIMYELYGPDRELVKAGKSSRGNFSFSIDNPSLWYPMNYGEQPLYTLQMEIRDRKKLLDRSTVEFGIRDLP